MLNLNSTINLDVKTALRWWGRELSFLVPKKIKQLLSDQQGFIIIKAENHQLILSYQLGKQIEQLAIFKRDKSAITQYQDLLASDNRLSKAQVIVRLTEQDAIQKELTLPIAAKENLYQVVAYELDRYTPFKAEQVYFAVKRLPTQLEAGQLTVLLVLTTRTVLNALYAEVKAMGIVPLIADYENAQNDFKYGKSAYNLLPDWLKPRVAKTPRIIRFALLSLVCALLGAVLVTPVFLEYKAVNRLTEKANKLEKEVNQIKALQFETSALMDETQQLLNEKTTTPSMLFLLNTLSNLMKDDTSIAYLQYTNGQLQLQGESPTASSLIAVLEESAVFNHATFISPVTQDSVSKKEFFQITVKPTTQANSNGK